MIPPSASSTIYRNRISRQLAFPVGYELLREHLGLSLLRVELRFRFRDRPTLWASDFAQMLRELRPYKVLSVEFRGEAVSSWGPGWTFTVYPVLREFKRDAREALTAGVFPRVRDFIARLPHHAHYYNRAEVSFDSVERTCHTEQLHPTE